MCVMPSSTASRSTATAAPRSAGGPNTCGPASCIAPYPMRVTVRSPPIVNVPPGSVVVGMEYPLSWPRGRASPGCTRPAAASACPDSTLYHAALNRQRPPILGVAGPGSPAPPVTVRAEDRSGRSPSLTGPRDLVRGAGVDHPVRGDAVALGPHAAVFQPVELARGVRVGVDGEHAACLGGQAQEPARRVAAFRPAVDLDRDAVLAAGTEHRLRIELRFRAASPAPAQQPAGAVPEHVHVRVAD